MKTKLKPLNSNVLEFVLLIVSLHSSRLGLLADDIVVEKRANPLDTLSVWLSKRLSYGPNERDIVILHHQVGVTWPTLSEEESEIKTIDMVVYGDAKYSAMAKTVGLPAAIATRMLLNSTVD